MHDAGRLHRGDLFSPQSDSTFGINAASLVRPRAASKASTQDITPFSTTYDNDLYDDKNSPPLHDGAQQGLQVRCMSVRYAAVLTCVQLMRSVSEHQQCSA